eukprot:gene37425-42386_t
MKKLITSIALIAAMAGFSGQALAAEGGDLAELTHHAAQTGHYPILKPKQMDWSFAGPFGKYDKAQLQRGLKVYTEVCSACHSMNLVAFRTLEDLGYSEAQVKAFAANYEVTDGPNADGEIGGTPICNDNTVGDTPTFVLCFLNRIKPAHTVLNVEIL